MGLRGATALVTGGNAGLGQRICRALTKEGVHVAVMYRSRNSRSKLMRRRGITCTLLECTLIWRARFSGLDVRCRPCAGTRYRAAPGIGTSPVAGAPQWESPMKMNVGPVTKGARRGRRDVGAQPVRTNLSTLRSVVNPA
jgi:hypothetical protein